MSVNNKTSKRERRKKLAVRILALILAGLMVLGVAYILIASAASSVSAAEPSAVLNTSSLKDGGDVLVSVGLLYGDDVEPEFGIRTENGYTLGIQELEDEKTFTEIWELKENDISCISDANIAKSNGIYSIAAKPAEAYIGGFHVQIDCDDVERKDFETLYSDTATTLAATGLSVIPAYIYTGYAIRVGDFATWDDAAKYVEVVTALYPEKKVGVVAPTRNAVCVIDSHTDKILFEYDCGLNSVIGFKAHKDANGNTYIKTPAGNVYDGVFAFKRFVDARNDGVSLINILPLEAYIAGVLPNEISNSWPIEVQKEFAITVRSFTLTHLNSKHALYGFDLCNTTCCEVYRGAGKINDAVMTAVTETKGKVICYDGAIVTSYYSSTVGGVTVSSADCWGGKEVPYLQAIETPWEDYMNHANGFWQFEVSPTALCERLNRAGFSSLKDAIADVKIAELAKNSTYVKKLTVTDVHGNSVTIVNTDRVRTSLTPYVNSANFVVGKGSVEYTEAAVVEKTVDSTADYGEKASGLTSAEEIHVVTSGYVGKIDYTGYVRVLTADGQIDYIDKNVFAVTESNANAFNAGNQNVSSVNKVETPSDIKSNVTYKTAKASDPNNFIFVGKGWGHGVGMSQWGCYDLAVKGYKYDEIIKAYFPNITLVDYRSTKNFANK